MPNVLVKHIDAFSHIPGKGNPAGVVLNGQDYTDQQMQDIAAAVGFNETAFVCPTESADFRIRFFTPGHEMNLCGHATMGSIYALKQSGCLTNNTLTIETNAGLLSVQVEEKTSSILITMQHAKPEFLEFNGSHADLAHAIGLSENDLDAQLPVVYGSTGVWTLIIPIKSLSSFKQMEPKTKQFPNNLKEMPSVSLHPICLETRDAESDMHARHFSSPYSGTIEDAVTGTASGVMGAYYVNYIQPLISLPKRLIVEQGHEINKDGKVFVDVTNTREELQISITGTAVYVKDIEVEII